MSVLLPIVLVAMKLSVDRVPDLNYETGCRAAAQSGVSANRNADACMRDEQTARATLEKEWSQFTVAQRRSCTSLTQLGGPPSYVELLTCLELAKQAESLPKDEGPIPPVR